MFNNGNDAKSFNEEMLQKGIILRHLIGWGFPDCIRVTIGLEEENKYFVECLAAILSKV